MSKDNTGNLNKLTPKLFAPTILRAINQPEPGSITHSISDFDNSDSDTSLGVTSSFRYNVPGTGLVSTQQLNVDWSEFQNHCFFNSAQVKTNVAFNKILKEFPFDGSKKELETFVDKLSGFDKYVFDNFPKNTGYLIFSGTNVGETFGGTYVTVKDSAGALYPNSSINVSGDSFINPGNNSMTIEFQIYVPEMSSSNQTILDKHLNDQGFSIVLNSTGSLNSGSMSFHVVSGSTSDSVSFSFDKGTWTHVAWIWDRTPGVDALYGFKNHVLAASSSMPVEFGFIDARSSNLLIGSGSSITDIFTPQTTFSGAMDELRIWNNIRTLEQRKDKEKKNVFAQDSLVAYYRFNEPSDIDSSMVLDYSSNSLHGKLSPGGITLEVRNITTSSYEAGQSPLTYEKQEFNPILFPEFEDTETFRQRMLVSASNYDQFNPNLITKLIPKHYLLEGQYFDALSSEEGPIIESLQLGSDPRSSNLKATQTLLLLLYTWASFFDEIKLFTQAFSDISWVDYDTTDTTPDEFLRFVGKQYGIELPPLFRGSSINQYINGENIENDYGFSSLSLQQVQNQIWRRILININDIQKSKGTIHSLKSFLRATGIDPDKNFRIREYGGPSKRTLDFVRETRTETTTFLDFVSGGFITTPGLKHATGDDYVREPGFPEPWNSDVDVFLTSGSWTFEGLYKFSSPNYSSQSLARMHVTCSSFNNATTTDLYYLNLIHVSGSEHKTELCLKKSNTFDSSGPDSELMQLSITGVDLFDGDPWYVSFGKRRGDDGLDHPVSSSYFLRLAKQMNGSIMESYVTSALYPQWYFLDPESIGVFSYNISGSLLEIGSGSIPEFSGSGLVLNQVLNAYDLDPYFKTTNFDGKISQLRFWSKYLTDEEWPEHVRNYRSVGVQDPNSNFNFNMTNTGSWQRLRVHAEMSQPITQSDTNGIVYLTDFTQNGFTLTGSNFSATSSILVPEQVNFSYISPKFDEGTSVEKIRIRSLLNNEDSFRFGSSNESWIDGAPVYDIPSSETPTDSTKLSIDYSIVDSLNQDIISIFSTLDELDNVLGNPELMFSSEYPGLESLREVYFNKLTDKINIKGFFEFFKWFDSNIGTFLGQLLPHKTRFLGTNYVIEQHALERNKAQYHFEDAYLGESNRNGLKDTIILQIITGFFSR